MKSKVRMGSMLVGLIVGGIAYWFESFVQTGIPASFFIWSVGAFFGALLLMLFLNGKPPKIALLVALGIALAVLFRIIYDTTFVDSTSHNLAPFEFIICGIITIPSAFGGSYLGLLIKKFKK